MAVQVFLDTNVLLDFYSFPKDDLDELARLRDEVNSGRLVVWSTDHVVEELMRNRESKILESIKVLDEVQPPSNLPAILEGLDSFGDYELARDEFGKAAGLMRKELLERVDRRKLVADQAIAELLDLSTVIPRSTSILARARDRVDLGNPPGKKGSLGDAINWECLLETCQEADICIVTRDSDFGSPIDPDRLAAFLYHEWTEEKNHEAVLYRRLATFFKMRLPEIEFRIETEQDVLVQNLVYSDTFAATHRAIERLAGTEQLTPAQALILVEALTDNPQIHMIRLDDDVRRFYSNLVEPMLGQLPEKFMQMYDAKYRPTRLNDDES